MMTIMTSVPPPTNLPGHYYRVDMEIEDSVPVTFDMTVPSSMSEINMATLRVSRYGGPTDEDHAFRRELYTRIGAIAVAGGHVETSMKRLLLLLRSSDSKFSLVDKTWTDLHKGLVAECTGSDGRRIHLKCILDWAEEKRLKGRRDNVIHAYWWNYDGCGVLRSRFYRRDDGAQIVSSLSDLEEDANLLFHYALMLDGLLGESWARATLPGKSGFPDSPVQAGDTGEE